MKVLKLIGIWLTEAAISGAPMIPLFIYVTSFFQHEGELSYVLPFVLFYSFNKTGEFILEIFGTINNPYRIAQLGAVLVIVGAVSSLFGEFAFAFSDIGATLVGFGTALYGPMYRALKETLQGQGKFPYKRPELVGFLLMTVFSALIFLARGRIQETVIFGYVILSVIALISLRSLQVDPADIHKPLFIYANHDLRKGIPALCFLGIVLFVRLFKQTANVQDILVVFVLSTAVIFVVMLRKTYAVHQTFEFHGVFYSEVLIYVILYDIFFYISQGDITAILMVNLAQFAGQFFGLAFGKTILSKFPNLKVSNILVIIPMAVGILFLFPATNYLAVALIGFLTQLGHIRVSKLYHKDTNLSISQIYMVNQKMGSIGLVTGQSILIGVLTIVSFIMLHNSTTIMESYAFHIPKTDLTSVFTIIQFICMGIFWIQGIVLLIIEKHKFGTIFKETVSDEKVSEMNPVKTSESSSGEIQAGRVQSQDGTANTRAVTLVMKAADQVDPLTVPTSEETKSRA